jgi:hypothetical protein
MALTNSRDMLSLAKAGLPELLAVLEEDATFVEDTPKIPRRSKRVARRILAESIRLIRLGTRKEVAEAALELAESLTLPAITRFEEPYPNVYRLINSAADALAAATPPSSGGSELTVLRSWKGRARKALAIVNQATDQAVARADLRAQLNLSEDYLSHMLADMEAAGLVVRVKSGKVVTVHLGLVGRSSHVQDLLPKRDPHPDLNGGTNREQTLYTYLYSDVRTRYQLLPKVDNELLHAYTAKSIGNFEGFGYELGDTDVHDICVTHPVDRWVDGGAEDQVRSALKPLIARKDHLLKV